MAVADFPLLGMRTRMMVSVLVASSSPARSVASSSSRERVAVRVGPAVHADQQDVDRAVLAAATERFGKDVVDPGFERADLAPRHTRPDDDRRRHQDGDDPEQAGQASAQVTCVRGADPVAASRRARLCFVVHRIVITGAGGQVGRFLAQEAGRQGLDVLALTSAQWDITDAGAAEGVVEPGDVVVNCAAFTAVDAAETEPDRAHAVNAVGPGNVARACAKVGARMIHISTDYVFSGAFDGTPRPYDIDDATGPLSVYGKTKLAGEQAVHAALPDGHVVRTSWVYTGVGSDFVGAMRRLAAGDEPVSVVVDQIGSPTYVADLVAALLQVADRATAPPLLHVANEGAASRFEQARAVFEGIGADPERVRPVPARTCRGPRARPPYSALSGRAVDGGGPGAAAAVARRAGRGAGEAERN